MMHVQIKKVRSDTWLNYTSTTLEVNWAAGDEHMYYYSESTHLPTCFEACHYKKILLSPLKLRPCRWAPFVFEYRLFVVVHIRNTSMFSLGRTVINK